MSDISVCLISGGIDSAVAATLAARAPSTTVHLLSIFYGQGAEAAERVHAARVGDRLMATFDNVREHFVLEIAGGVRATKKAARHHSWAQGFVGWRSPRQGWDQAGYPSTRDEVFTLIAAAGAEARLRDNPTAVGAEVVLATNGDDLKNFSDLKASTFHEHLQAVLDKKLMPANGKPIKIHLPLIDLSKVEIVALGQDIGAPLDLTWSCYFGAPGRPCGTCDQCRWRSAAFASVKIADPAGA